MFFRLNSWELALIIFAVVGAATLAGYAGGRYLREHSSTLREPFGVLQAALLGVVGLILAFGLSLAVGRYEDRRAATVAEANAIGTTYLRAQLIAEPARTRSLDLLRRYTTLALAISKEVPNSAAMKRTTAAEGVLQRRLWRLAGQAIAAAPVASAPRLYVDSLNTTIDQQSVRLASLNNRVPGAVLGARGDRRGGRARAARAAHLDPRPRSRPDAGRRRARDSAAARHLRPRPTDPRPDQGAGDAAGVGARVDGAAARPLADPSRTPARPRLPADERRT